MPNVQHYREKIEPRLSTIQDSTIKNLVKELLKYTENLECYRRGLPPKYPELDFTSKSFGPIINTAYFSGQIPIQKLPDTDISEIGTSVRQIVSELLELAKSLELK